MSDPREERRRQAREALVRSELPGLARVLDTQFRIPGTGFRFGIEPLIGLIPGVGDIFSGGLGFYLIARAIRFRVPAVVIGRMLFNTVLDAVVGVIPVVGDLFDFAYRSNARNIALLERYVTEPGADTREHKRFLLGIVLVFIGVLALVAWVVITLLNELLRLVT